MNTSTEALVADLAEARQTLADVMGVDIHSPAKAALTKEASPFYWRIQEIAATLRTRGVWYA